MRAVSVECDKADDFDRPIGNLSFLTHTFLIIRSAQSTSVHLKVQKSQNTSLYFDGGAIACSHAQLTLYKSSF